MFYEKPLTEKLLLCCNLFYSKPSIYVRNIHCGKVFNCVRDTICREVPACTQIFLRRGEQSSQITKRLTGRNLLHRRF